MTILRGRGHLATKINITFLVENEVLNIFGWTILLKKKIQYFLKEPRFFLLGGGPIFKKWGIPWQKWIKLFSWKIVYRIRVWSFFLKKAHTGWMKAKKLVLGAHFPPYQWFYWGWLFPKTLSPTMWISWKLVQNYDLYCDSNYYYKLKTWERNFQMLIEKHVWGFAARKYIHWKENFMGNKLHSY